jgi:hypothetical protein
MFARQMDNFVVKDARFALAHDKIEERRVGAT